MASTDYAKMVLRVAGLQHANRSAVVVKQQMRSIREKAGGAPVTWGAGSVSMPTFEYSGSRGARLNPSDPHQGLFCLALVDGFLGEQPRFDSLYRRHFVEGRYRPQDQEQVWALVKALAEHIGAVPEERTVVQSHVSAWRKQKALDRREYMNAWKREKRRKEAATAIIALLDARISNLTSSIE